MMDEATKHQFIECRASGMSFDRIAEKLKVSKPTLINWSRDSSLEIQNLKALADAGILTDKEYRNARMRLAS